VTKFEPLPESAQCQPLAIGEKYKFARKFGEACDALAKMGAQRQSILVSIRDSRKAIQESRILLLETDMALVQ